MSGNVWEWCWDYYNPSDRRTRGGSYLDEAYRSEFLHTKVVGGQTYFAGLNFVNRDLRWPQLGLRLARNIGPKISISGTLPEATLNQAYSGYTFGAVGSTGDKVWSISEGNLPPGMSFSANGTLSGTPITAGTYTFVIRLESGGYWDELEVELEVVAPKNYAVMVTVQGGTLPANNDLFVPPREAQVVSTFQIGKYEVTWGEWQAVRNWAVSNGYPALAGIGQGAGDDYPVGNVNWFHVVMWCNAKSQMEGLTPVYYYNGEIYKIGVLYGWNSLAAVTANTTADGYRLPKDAEWEWAARGGISSKGFNFSGGNDVNLVAWYWGNALVDLNGSRHSSPVGQKAGNELGLYDMSGNVAEWCEDFVGGPRRIRGGWYDTDWGDVRVANRRYSQFPGTGYPSYGFRLARNVELSSIVWDWNNGLQGWDINEYDSGNIVQLENGQEGMGIVLNSYRMVNYNVPRWFKVGDVLNNGFIEVDMKHVVPSVHAVYIDVYVYGSDGWGRFIYYPYDGYTSKSENLGSGWMRYRLVPSPGFDKVHEYDFMTPKPDSPRVSFSYNSGSFPLEIDNFVLQD
jgi:formylglycine-generating enzyme required for sulfatase activity